MMTSPALVTLLPVRLNSVQAPRALVGAWGPCPPHS